MNIDVLLAVNGDGNLIRRNILALPNKVFQCDGLEPVLSHRLVVLPKSIIPRIYNGLPPMEFGIYTSRLFVADGEEPAVRLAVGLSMKTDVDMGDITIVGSDAVTGLLDGMGIDYRLAIVAPLNVQIPEKLFDGFERDGSSGDERYTVHYFKPSLTATSDVKMANLIDGAATGFELSEAEQETVDHFAKDFARFYKQEMKRSEVDSYDDGNDSDVEDDELGQEMELLWKSAELAQSYGINAMHSAGKVAADLEKTKADVAKAMEIAVEASKPPAYRDMIPVRVTQLESSVNNITTQFSSLMDETQTAFDKMGKSVRILRVMVIALAVLVLMLGTALGVSVFAGG